MFLHGVFLSKSDESASGYAAYPSDAGRKARGPIAENQVRARGARGQEPLPLGLAPASHPHPRLLPQRADTGRPPRCPSVLSDLTWSKRNSRPQRKW